MSLMLKKLTAGTSKRRRSVIFQSPDLEGIYRWLQKDPRRRTGSAKWIEANGAPATLGGKTRRSR